MDEALPKGWIECLMGDIAKVVGGGTPKTKDESNFTEDGIPWLTPADLSGYKEMYISCGRRFLSQKGLDTSSSKLMPEGTLLFSSRAPVGYVAIANNPIATNQGFKNFILKEGIDSKYAYYYLKSSKNVAEALASGTTFLELSGKNAAKIPIRLPPLPEQKRIADKLDCLLAKVDVCKARLDKVPEIIKRFRQSVLADATSGRLTEDWRGQNPNISDVKSFFRENRHERREWWEKDQLAKFAYSNRIPKDDKWKKRYKYPDLIDTKNLPPLVSSWRWGSVEEISNKVVDGVHKKPHYVESGVPFVTVKNLTAGPGISFEKLNYITEEDHLQYIKRAHPKKGDVLVSKDGTLGVIRIIDTDKEFSIFVSVALIKPVIKGFGNYLSYVLQAPLIQSKMIATGTGLQHIHLRDLRKVPIPIPPIEEQKEIVQRVEVLFSVADQMGKKLKSAQNGVEKLTASTLAKAFRGELVPQDPNDESAEKLLELANL